MQLWEKLGFNFIKELYRSAYCFFVKDFDCYYLESESNKK